jgi:hypothetical protein
MASPKRFVTGNTSLKNLSKKNKSPAPHPGKQQVATASKIKKFNKERTKPPIAPDNKGIK